MTMHNNFLSFHKYTLRSLAWSFFILLGLFNSSFAIGQSLHDAIVIALNQYPSILAAQSNSAAAAADINRASAQHWPQIAWQGTQSTYSDVAASPFAPNNTWIQSPTVSVNIWSGWRIQSEVERAEALSEASKVRQKITKDDVALIVSEAYLNWARLLRLVELAQQNVNAHKRIAADIDKIVAVDAGRRIDAEQAQVRLENANLSFRQRQSELAVVIARLNRMLLGQVPAKPSGLNQEVGAIPSQSSEALDLINDSHPVIAEQIAQIKAAEAQIRNARSEYSPTVNLSYGKQVTQGTGQGDYVTQLTVSMPIFSGGSTKAALTGAYSLLQSAQYRLQEARLSQRERLLSAWSEWESAKSRTKLGIRQMAKGKEVVSGYEKQFRVGKRSLLDLLNVQTDLYNYQTAATNAEFEEKIFRARILASLGQLANAYQAH